MRRPRATTTSVVTALGVVLAAVSIATAPHRAGRAASQAWPAFVLVLGLLLLGFAAAEDGTFVATARLLARLPGHRWLVYAGCMGLVAVTSVLLNLDTAVAFLTPVLVLLARERGDDEGPLLYGCVLMSNSASLLLPGSNLTNLIVLRHEQVSGLTFAHRIWPAWVVAVAVTALVPALLLRRSGNESREPATARTSRTPGITLLAVPVAVGLMLGLAQPALPVLAVGAVSVVAVLAQGRTSTTKLAETVDVTTLVGLFGLAVSAGTLARAWTSPSRWLADANRWATAGAATLAAVAINNLPAAMLLSAHDPAHPRALLLGLDIGPNIAVSGSLSALLWLQAARTVDARPTLRAYSLLGVVTAATAIPLGLLVIRG